jgi:hypothetical protein
MSSRVAGVTGMSSGVVGVTWMSSGVAGVTGMSSGVVSITSTVVAVPPGRVIVPGGTVAGGPESRLALPDRSRNPVTVHSDGSSTSSGGRGLAGAAAPGTVIGTSRRSLETP